MSDSLPMEARPKAIKVDHLEFVKSVAGGDADPGYVVIGDRVLVLVDEVAKQSSGGIILTDDKVDKQNARSQTGVIIGMGDAAFHWTFDRTREWYGTKPQIGTRVHFERYAGSFIVGADGRYYRIMDDKCIAAIEVSPESAGTEATAKDTGRIDVV